MLLVSMVIGGNTENQGLVETNDPREEEEKEKKKAKRKKNKVNNLTKQRKCGL